MLLPHDPHDPDFPLFFPGCQYVVFPPRPLRDFAGAAVGAVRNIDFPHRVGRPVEQERVHLGWDFVHHACLLVFVVDNGHDSVNL